MKKDKVIKILVIMLLFMFVFNCENQSIANSTTKYTMTNFISHDNGGTWKYILVDKNIKTSEMIKIAKELHKKYPKNFFRFYSDLSTLKKMYIYDSTNSYATGKVAYPEQAFNKDNQGIVNVQYGYGWAFTTKEYELIKL